MKSEKINLIKYFSDIIEESEKCKHYYVSKLKHISEKEEMDNCVNCGKQTSYSKNMCIDYRKYYIEGSGQLCKDCYDKIYK